MDRLQIAEFKAAVAARPAGAETEDADEDALDAPSNTEVDLVRAAKLDEAEAAARDLLRRFPNVHDGWDRLGMVHEARGDNRQAADCYRKVIDFIRRHPDRYEWHGRTVCQAGCQARSAHRRLNASPSLALNEGAGCAATCNSDQSAEILPYSDRAYRDASANRRQRLEILNERPWEEAILFACERISRADEAGRAAVATLVNLALAIDPMLAAEMIYRSATGVWDGIKDNVLAFASRWHVADKDDRAIRFMIITGRPEFAPALRLVPAAINFVRHFVEKQKPIAAICHGPWTLIDAGGVKGKTMTSWPSLKTDLCNAGAKWVDQQAVTDGNLVTSRKPDDLMAFNKAMIETFSRSHAAAALEAAGNPGRLHVGTLGRNKSKSVRERP